MPVLQQEKNVIIGSSSGKSPKGKGGETYERLEIIITYKVGVQMGGDNGHGKFVLIFKFLTRNGYSSSFLNNPRPYAGSLIVVASFVRHLELPYF